ncbi:ATP-binding protein [Frankia gtarii]|uniref:ATP-binding protein n=1 Tax=Frankia gtarii TaxID=2950102 RepID=UPI0021C06531
MQVQTQNIRATQLADQILPAVVKRLRDGASPDAVLADVAEAEGLIEAGGMIETSGLRTADTTDAGIAVSAPAAAAGATGIVREAGVAGHGDVAAGSGIGDGDREARETHQRILWTLATEIGRGERMRAAAMSACANAAGRVQALATSMLADLRDMEQRHDEEVFGDLLRLDHATAQAGRLADSIAVLTGARTGRRWTKPIVVESILRGAVGRISAYQRVRLHSTSTVAVAGYAAEGVMHALAELMDNATSFSPPSEEVHVYVEEVQAGIVVTIEDGGLVMGPAALRRAEAAVSAEPLDLTTLSGTRLGLAVVGVLARKHGLTVSFRPSSRGGTGVIVMIPRRLIAQPRPNPATPGMPMGETIGAAAGALGTAARAGAAGAPVGSTVRTLDRPAPDGTRLGGTELNRTGLGRTGLNGDAAAGRSDAPGTPVPDNPTGPIPRADVPGEPAAASPPTARETLPKRRRGETMANAVGRLPTAPASTPSSPPADAGARFGAFRRATRGEQPDAPVGATGQADAGSRPLPPLPPLPPSLTGPTKLPEPPDPPDPSDPSDPNPIAGDTASGPDQGLWFQTRGGTDSAGTNVGGHPSRRDGNS